MFFWPNSKAINALKQAQCNQKHHPRKRKELQMYVLLKNILKYLNRTIYMNHFFLSICIFALYADVI